MSGFGTLTQTLVKQAMGILGDPASGGLTSAITYSSNGEPTYDTTTGTTTATPTVYTFNAVVAKFGFDQTDSKVVVKTDAKIVAAALDLPVEPRENDTVVTNGKNWKVIRSLGVPGGSVLVIHIREV